MHLAKIEPRTVWHEVGHVFGFGHTGDATGSFMSYAVRRSCTETPSATELAHVAYAYARRDGNRDPDTDPT